jgi:acyl-coenzyme A thioesterase PaaI-like protein
MAIAPSMALAVVGAAVGGAGNGTEIVAVRTMLQEETEEGWMAMIMSFTESITEAVPGAGIVLGGAIAALADARVALAVAGAGSFFVAVLMWVMLKAPRMASKDVTPIARNDEASHRAVLEAAPPPQ